MSRLEVTGRKVADLSVPRAAYTIAEFCEAHRISEQMYFKLKRLGLQPRETYVGTRVLISMESAAEWRRAAERRQHPPINQQEVTT